jgi:hypothetical protein
MDLSLAYWAFGAVLAGAVLVIASRRALPAARAPGLALLGIGVSLLILFGVLAAVGAPRPGEGNAFDIGDVGQSLEWFVCRSTSVG